MWFYVCGDVQYKCNFQHLCALMFHSANYLIVSRNNLARTLILKVHPAQSVLLHTELYRSPAHGQQLLSTSQSCQKENRD